MAVFNDIYIRVIIGLTCTDMQSPRGIYVLDHFFKVYIYIYMHVNRYVCQCHMFDHGISYKYHIPLWIHCIIQFIILPLCYMIFNGSWTHLWYSSNANVSNNPNPDARMGLVVCDAGWSPRFVCRFHTRFELDWFYQWEFQDPKKQVLYITVPYQLIYGHILWRYPVT